MTGISGSSQPGVVTAQARPETQAERSRAAQMPSFFVEDYRGIAATPFDMWQSAVTAAQVWGGGFVDARAGAVYDLDKPAGPGAIQLLPDNTGNSNPVIIRGKGCRMILSTNTPRLFDVAKSADYDTFHDLDIRDFLLDGNNVGGSHHTIIGAYINGNHSVRLNYDQISLRRIKVVNVPQDLTGATARYGIMLPCAQLGNVGAEPIMNTCTNILCEAVEMYGCDSGISITAPHTGNEGVNVYYDNIRLHRCKHKPPSIATSFRATVNFHIGNKGFGDYCEIISCEGHNSGDVSIEVDAMQTTVIERCRAIDPYTEGILFANIGPAQDPLSQTFTVKNCRTTIKNLDTASSTYGGHALAVGGSQPLGTLAVDGLVYYHPNAVHTHGGGWVGMAITAVPATPIHKITLNNVRVRVPGATYDNAASNGASLIELGSTSVNTIYELGSIDIQFDCNRSGAGTLSMVLVNLGAATGGTVRVNGYDFDYSLTNGTIGAGIGIKIGGGGTSTLRGFINGLRVTQMGGTGDTNPTAIKFDSSTTLTLDPYFTISNSDFKAMTNGTEVGVISNDAVIKAKLRHKNNVYRTNPPASAAITVGASAFTYQNIDGYDELVSVTGGTVSLIERSVDGTNYFTTGLIVGLFPVPSGQYLRVTYSVAPTMRTFPTP